VPGILLCSPRDELQNPKASRHKEIVFKLHDGMRDKEQDHRKRSWNIFVWGYSHRLNNHAVDEALFVTVRVRIAGCDRATSEWGKRSTCGGSGRE